jgi:CheY-like chemotaxis protein
MTTRDLLAFFDSDVDFSRQEGFALLVVEDGLEAWRELDQSWPNLVMMDLNAAGMAGDEFSRRINKDAHLRHIPVVLMVASQNSEDLNRCLKARCADILFKPLSKHLLMAAARRILGLPFRSFPRTPMCLEVRYGLNDRDIHTGSCVNLCSGGMFIETRQPLPLEQLLHVDFLLPGTTRVIASPASIAWINTEQDPVNKNLPPGMGLQFLSLNLNDLLAICRYIRLRTE